MDAIKHETMSEKLDHALTALNQAQNLFVQQREALDDLTGNTTQNVIDTIDDLSTNMVYNELAFEAPYRTDEMDALIQAFMVHVNHVNNAIATLKAARYAIALSESASNVCAAWKADAPF